MGVVEHVHRQVQDAVRRGRIFQYLFVYRAGGELAGKIARCRKIIGFQIPLSYHKKVEENERADARGGDAGPGTALYRPENQHGSGSDEQEGSEGVGAQQHPAVGGERIGQHLGLPGIGRGREIACETRHQPA